MFGPYMMPPAYIPMASTASRGLLSGLLGRGIDFSSILTNTGKVLGIANQAIPVIKQASPVFKNAKTMFKVMNEFKRNDSSPNKNNTSSTNTNIKNSTNNNINQNTKENTNNISNTSFDGGPTFFM